MLTTPDVNTDAAVEALRAADPALLVVVAFGQILRADVRGVPRDGSLNLHFSLLPRWRGAAPVQRAILAGDEETGVAVQRLVARLDAGPVIALERVSINHRDDTPSLRERLVETGSSLLADVVARLLAGEPIVAAEQDESLVTVAAKIRRQEGGLDPTAEGAADLSRRVRALGDQPGCPAVLVRPGRGDVPVLVREAWAVDEVDTVEDASAVAGTAPGAVLAADAAGVLVATIAGVLRVTILQKQGKRALPVRDFLNGCPLERGDLLIAGA